MRFDLYDFCVICSIHLYTSYFNIAS